MKHEVAQTLFHAGNITLSLSLTKLGMNDNDISVRENMLERNKMFNNNKHVHFCKIVGYKTYQY
jgi:hypothetical protein